MMDDRALLHVPVEDDRRVSFQSYLGSPQPYPRHVGVFMVQVCLDLQV